MKINIIIFLILFNYCFVFGEGTNDFTKKSENGSEIRSETENINEKKIARKERIEEKRAEGRKRQYEFMNDFLKELGIEEAERIKIFNLQEKHHERMKENYKKSNEARIKLTELQDIGATEAEIDAAIEVVVATQAEQLRILVKNRMEMEKIMGVEKYKQFMDKARQQFRRHEERGGEGITPKPELSRKDKI